MVWRGLQGYFAALASSAVKRFSGFFWLGANS
jgi:hypothetical protein